MQSCPFFRLPEGQTSTLTESQIFYTIIKYKNPDLNDFILFRLCRYRWRQCDEAKSLIQWIRRNRINKLFDNECSTSQFIH